MRSSGSAFCCSRLKLSLILSSPPLLSSSKNGVSSVMSWRLIGSTFLTEPPDMIGRAGCIGTKGKVLPTWPLTPRASVVSPPMTSRSSLTKNSLCAAWYTNMERKRINMVIIKSDQAIDQWEILGIEDLKAVSSIRKTLLPKTETSPFLEMVE